MAHKEVQGVNSPAPKPHQPKGYPEPGTVVRVNVQPVRERKGVRWSDTTPQHTGVRQTPQGASPEAGTPRGAVGGGEKGLTFAYSNVIQ